MYCGSVVIMSVYSLVAEFCHCTETSCLCLLGRRTCTQKTGIHVADYMLYLGLGLYAFCILKNAYNPKPDFKGEMVLAYQT
jgi:hypothetical protein